MCKFTGKAPLYYESSTGNINLHLLVVLNCMKYAAVGLLV